MDFLERSMDLLRPYRSHFSPVWHMAGPCCRSTDGEALNFPVGRITTSAVYHERFRRRAELAGGVLIIIGLFTRPVAFILSGMLAVAYFYAHAPSGFFPIRNGGELAALYSFVFLYLAAAGGGAWSVDRALRGVEA
jgi:putative oxidoreductase